MILVNFVHSPSFFSHAAKQRTWWTELGLDHGIGHLASMRL